MPNIIIDDHDALVQYNPPNHWIPGGSSGEFMDTTSGSVTFGDTDTLVFEGKLIHALLFPPAEIYTTRDVYRCVWHRGGRRGRDYVVSRGRVIERLLHTCDEFDNILPDSVDICRAPRGIPHVGGYPELYNSEQNHLLGLLPLRYFINSGKDTLC